MTDAERKRMADMAFALKLLGLERHYAGQERKDGSHPNIFPMCQDPICSSIVEATKDP